MSDLLFYTSQYQAFCVVVSTAIPQTNPAPLWGSASVVVSKRAATWTCSGFYSSLLLYQQFFFLIHGREAWPLSLFIHCDSALSTFYHNRDWAQVALLA